MDSFDRLLSNAEKFARCLDKNRGDGRDDVAVLNEAHALRIQATEEALKHSSGTSRRLILQVREKAGTIERDARRRLMPNPRFPSPSGVA